MGGGILEFLFALERLTRERAERDRRGEPHIEGEGEGDQVKRGVGGCDEAECVHVREQTVQVVDEQLEECQDGQKSSHCKTYIAH